MTDGQQGQGQQVDTSNMTPEQIAQLQQQNCIFCHIISGKVPSKKVFEDEETLGILDINPAGPGHVLLLPKKHHAIMPQMNDIEIGHIFQVSKGISGALLKALKAEGTNIFVANGQIAGQKAPHFMVHVIPRREGDGLNFNLPENNIQRQELEKIRQMLMPKIKEHLGMSDDDVKQMLSKGSGQQPVTDYTGMQAAPAQDMGQQSGAAQQQSQMQQRPANPPQGQQQNQVPAQARQAQDQTTAQPQAIAQQQSVAAQDEPVNLDAISSLLNPRASAASTTRQGREEQYPQQQTAQETQEAAGQQAQEYTSGQNVSNDISQEQEQTQQQSQRPQPAQEQPKKPEKEEERKGKISLDEIEKLFSGGGA